MYAFHYNSQGSEFSIYFLIIFTQRSGYLFHCLRIGSNQPSEPPLSSSTQRLYKSFDSNVDLSLTRA